MITFIHGDDTVNSRQKLDELTRDQKALISINISKVTLGEAFTALESQDLFSQEKTIVFENVLSLSKTKS